MGKLARLVAGLYQDGLGETGKADATEVRYSDRGVSGGPIGQGCEKMNHRDTEQNEDYIKMSFVFLMFPHLLCASVSLWCRPSGNYFTADHVACDTQKP